MKFAVFVFAILVACNALELQEEWVKFQRTYGKSYRSPVEMKKRYAIFAENLDKINAHNILHENGERTWKMGVTQFTDLTEQEFLDLTTTNLEETEKIETVATFKASANSDAPDSMDWREKGAVTEVKNQGSCGSCWSFSATGALEGLIKISYDRMISLSEQNLIDCATPPNATSYGCRGGQMVQAFAYVRDHGIVTEDEYPYQGVQGTCQQNRIVFQIGGYVNVATDEESLRQAVGTKGPISVGIQSTANLQNYQSGVLIDDLCTTRPNHGVLAVGYGTENGQDYWLIKNSWGAQWGDQGYFKLARNMNMCFIATSASYPTIEY